MAAMSYFTHRIPRYPPPPPTRPPPNDRVPGAYQNGAAFGQQIWQLRREVVQCLADARKRRGGQEAPAERAWSDGPGQPAEVVRDARTFRARKRESAFDSAFRNHHELGAHALGMIIL